MILEVASFVSGERESEKGKEVKRVKRIFAILMAALFMVAVMLVMAAPALASPPPWKGNDKQFHQENKDCKGPPGARHQHCINNR